MNSYKYALSEYNTLLKSARHHTFSCIYVRVDVHLCYFSLVDIYNVYYMEMAVKDFAEAYWRITIIPVAQFFNLLYVVPRPVSWGSSKYFRDRKDTYRGGGKNKLICKLAIPSYFTCYSGRIVR